mmetsp:Transcript_13829/g.37691  ORF Transcript_13829/g.37691 Transcript_13829/m.37691 type:complete len:293 (+) Transcript_13829:82-960(+)
MSCIRRPRHTPAPIASRSHASEPDAVRCRNKSGSLVALRQERDLLLQADILALERLQRHAQGPVRPLLAAQRLLRLVRSGGELLHQLAEQLPLRRDRGATLPSNQRCGRRHIPNADRVSGGCAGGRTRRWRNAGVPLWCGGGGESAAPCRQGRRLHLCRHGRTSRGPSGLSCVDRAAIDCRRRALRLGVGGDRGCHRDLRRPLPRGSVLRRSAVRVVGHHSIESRCRLDACADALREVRRHVAAVLLTGRHGAIVGLPVLPRGQRPALCWRRRDHDARRRRGSRLSRRSGRC